MKSRLATLLIVLWSAMAQAALTDLDPNPMVTSTTQTVLPNVLFILDDSGSMAWTHMPDDNSDAGSSVTFDYGYYGYRSSQCNSVYYDPLLTYAAPQKADGTYYANATFTAAWTDGYKTADGTVNLSTSFRAEGDTANAPAYYFTYSGTQTAASQKDYNSTTNTFYLECHSALNATPGSTVFNKVVVGDSEKQNFANWYSYYRSRINMMRSVTGKAFQALDNTYRVGFMAINTDSSFVNLAPFDSTQKTAWYTKLYGTAPSGSTPLRTALADAGRLYAGKLSLSGVTVNDPVQYSCQKNFSILSTDGYWNTGAGYQINGSTAVGNQDGGGARPFYDGASASTTTTVTTTTQETYSSAGCSTGKTKITSTKTIRTVVTVNGTVTSDATVGPTTSTPVSCRTTPRALQTPNPLITTTVTTSSTGGSADSLADVAQYYYTTDLRTSSLSNCTGAQGSGTDVCLNNVPPTGADDATWQHMATFTLGLNVRGRMVFTPSYTGDASGDYFSVKTGATANPSTGVCTWQASGVCNWPVPGMVDSSNGKIENIDDLWHAAVNGRGTYFMATDPASLADGLANTLAGVTARNGAAAAVGVSNPNMSAGDNYVYSASFNTQEWDGELVRRQIDLDTGNLSPTADWSAQTLLDSNTARTLYTYDSSSANHLKEFQWANLTSTEQNYFNASALTSLTQFCSSGPYCLSEANKTSAAGANLVSFLRGDRSREGILTDTSKFYHMRLHVLGDLVNGEPLYVKNPMQDYYDAGYYAFAHPDSPRAARVYAPANDGMLHAFNAETGAESWAYIPSMVMPNLYKLADKKYARKHQFYVDGNPVSGDVYDGSAWHTILVGGLNNGGRGYYALDITNPAAPKAIWEFTDTNLGYSYGNPIITKLKDGTWVVLVTSGYNNVSPGDGLGRLYVLNAQTGAIIRQISTGVGSTTTPSGLGRINAWVNDVATNNITLHVYGGDLLGNLWRFDINGDVGAAGYDAQLLAQLKDANNNVQPITMRPELAEVSGQSVVYVGTGRFLGVTDLSSTSQQSFYAIKDPLLTTSTASTAIYDNPGGTTRSGTSSLGFVQQTQTNTTCPADSPAEICTPGEAVRSSSSNAVNFASDNGWYIDFPDSGERASSANTDPQLIWGTLLFTTSKPSATACSAGGSSVMYFVNYRTGGTIAITGMTNTIVGRVSANAFASRPSVVRMPNGQFRSLVTQSDNTQVNTPMPLGLDSLSVRRISWHEITD